VAHRTFRDPCHASLGTTITVVTAWVTLSSCHYVHYGLTTSLPCVPLLFLPVRADAQLPALQEKLGV
jgi:hypothetical protein